ncbi:MAG: hypothetical protein QXS14_05580 [Desulfurococcaceae archaeon]
MKVKKVEILKVDKDGSILMFLVTSVGNFRLWGRISSKGKIYDLNGVLVAKIDSSYAQILRNKALKLVQYAYAVAKEELEHVYKETD